MGPPLLSPAGKGSALQMRKLRLEEISEPQDQAHKPGQGSVGPKAPPSFFFSLHTSSLFKLFCGLG